MRKLKRIDPSKFNFYDRFGLSVEALVSILVSLDGKFYVQEGPLGSAVVNIYYHRQLGRRLFSLDWDSVRPIGLLFNFQRVSHSKLRALISRRDPKALVVFDCERETQL